MKKPSAASAFLRAAVAYYAALGVTVKEVMTDNGAVVIAAKTLLRPAAILGLAPSVHQALYPAHQRQSGTLHPERVA